MMTTGEYIEDIEDMKASLWVAEEKLRLAEGEIRTLHSDYNMLEQEYQALAFDYKSARERANSVEYARQALEKLAMEKAELQQQLRTAHETLAERNKRLGDTQQQNKHMLKQIVHVIAERDSLAQQAGSRNAKAQKASAQKPAIQHAAAQNTNGQATNGQATNAQNAGAQKATVGEKRPRSEEEAEQKRYVRRVLYDDVFAARFNEHGKLELKAPGPVATPYAVRVIQRERAPKVYYILIQDQEPLYCRSFRHMLQTMRAVARA